MELTLLDVSRNGKRKRESNKEIPPLFYFQ